MGFRHISPERSYWRYNPFATNHVNSALLQQFSLMDVFFLSLHAATVHFSIL